MTIRRTLSKSDFKLGTDCWTKLYYKKMGYHSANEDNEYLSFLADGGYLIGAVAKLYFPGGIDIDARVRQPDTTYQELTNQALDLTRELMQREEITLYEPAFQVGQRLVRVDVLVKKGNRLKLIEVKSKSQDGIDPTWNKEWDPYLDDLAFQLLVVRAAHSDCNVTPWLMTPDKSHAATIDNLTSQFQLQMLGWTGSFRNVDVKFVGDDVLAGQIRESRLLRAWDVHELIEQRLDDVERRAATFEKWLGEESLQHPGSPITKDCFKCEYDATGDCGRNGFHECWGELAMPELHIRHLYMVGTLGGWRNPRANSWINDGRTSQDDINEADLVGADGTLGTTAERILIQIAHTRTASEWIDVAGLRSELASWRYPLHFIDFEASSSPLPYHLGMHPYETVVFQWSCHTITEPEGRPTHREYLNTTAHYPAIEFLQSLKAAIGKEGTAVMWSHYERTQLKNLRDWMLGSDEGRGDGLLEWVEGLIESFDQDWQGDTPRLVDQHALVPRHWFHPRMAGRTSIKVALPAALAAAPEGRIDDWLREVRLLDPVTGARPDNPYLLLPGLDVPGLEADGENTGELGTVTDGVEAMRAYQDMVYGRYMNQPERHTQIKDSLRRYCQLDTLAQVIIWEHWRIRLGL